MRKFTESLSSIKKVEQKTISYYSIMPLLNGLETERPGFDYNGKFLQKLLNNHDPNRRPTSTDDEIANLLVNVMNRSGFDSLHDLHRKECIKKVGTPKFIME